MIRRLYTCSGSGTDPYRNLALERYLTETVPEDACILYLWQNQNTVVIGRNQNAWKECRTGLLEQEGGVLARRLSGGGAVFHDLGNLNFTFSVTEEDYDLPRQQQVILTACRLLGLRAELSGRNDLLVSVRSRVVNLRELCPDLTIEKMAEAMNRAFEQVYGLTAVPLQEQDFDHDALDALYAQFSSRDWVYGRSAPLDFACGDKFPWGEVSLHLRVEHGSCRDAAVYTDAMDAGLSAALEGALNGCVFSAGALCRALEGAAVTEEIRDDLCRLIRAQNI